MVMQHLDMHILTNAYLSETSSEVTFSTKYSQNFSYDPGALRTDSKSIYQS